MKSNPAKFRSVEEYLAAFPDDMRVKLQEVRATIQAAAPGAEEVIKYNMPTFMLHGNLVYFAGWKHHIGFYGVPNPPELQAETSKYAGPKGSLKFPLDEPLPLDLIRKLVQLRVAENTSKNK